MSITVENLTKKYGHQIAVNRLSFTARKGEVLGFLGPNGAGKTTSLRMIAGLLKPDSGRVLYGDMDIWDSQRKTRHNIGYLPETNPVYPDMYVREAMGFYAGIHGLHSREIEKAIVRVRLERESGKRVSQLSKGYRQRLGLAIAILHDPEILILDEPISGLDPNQMTGIRHLIRELALTKTILFSSHILPEVELICDRVLIIHGGELKAIDSLKSLREKQTGRQVIVAHLDVEVTAELMNGISSMDYCEVLDGNKVKLVALPGMDMRKELYDWTLQHKVTLLESRVEQVTMASLFEKLTQ